MVGGFIGRAFARRKAKQRAQVDGDTLQVGRERIPLSKLREGWIEPGVDHTTLVVCGRNGRIWRLEFEEEVVAELFLEACRLDPAQRSVRVLRQEPSSKGAARAVTWPLVPFAALFLWGTTLGDESLNVGLNVLTAIPLVLLALAGVHWAVRRFLRFSPLVIGADGLRWADSLGRHFLKHRGITSIERGKRYQSTNVLVLRSDAEVIAEIDLGEVSEEYFQAAKARLEKSLQGTDTALEILDRGSASLADWKERLRRLFGEDVYRGVHVPRVRVEETLENPHAAPERRVGAALALIETAEPKEGAKLRARVAELSESVADEPLAEAFKAVANNQLNDDALEALG